MTFNELLDLIPKDTLVSFHVSENGFYQDTVVPKHKRHLRDEVLQKQVTKIKAFLDDETFTAGIAVELR